MKREEQILELLRDNPLLSAGELAERLGTSRAAVAVHLSALGRKGEILGRGYVLRPDRRVVVIGGANIDLKCRSDGELISGTSNPGTTEMAVGGVARNVAHNLGQLGIPVSLVSIVGNDDTGDRILRETAAAGVDISNVLRSGKPTGAYTAILDRSGNLSVAVSAMGILDELTPERLEVRSLGLQNATLIVADCNLPAATLHYLIEFAARHRRRLIVDGVSVAKVHRLRSTLSADKPLFALAINRQEAEALVDRKLSNETTLKNAAGKIHEMGVENLLIGLADRGVHVSTDTGERQLIGSPGTAVVRDVTGAGDAALAGTIFALLKGEDLLAAVSIGQEAAALTVASAQTVAHALSPEALEARMSHRLGVLVK